MLILRRGLTWIVETAVSATLIGLWLCFYEGEPSSVQQPFLLQWWNYILMTLAVFMLGSGYLLTTAIGAMSPLRDQSIWLYPAAVTTLFVIHFWIFSGGWAPQSAASLYVVGVLVVFVCALAGNMALRKLSMSPMGGRSGGGGNG
jgi:hypothetical protein